MLTPTVEFGVRRDDGGAEIGAGVELGEALRFGVEATRSRSASVPADHTGCG